MRIGLGLGMGMSRGGGARYAYNGNFARDRVLPTGTTFTRANAVSTYIGADGYTALAGTNVARFTYDPTTLASLGLMAEESRINIIPYSRDMSLAGFTSSNLAQALGTGGIIGHDGTANTIKLTASGTANTYNYYEYVCAEAHTAVSFWMRKGSGASDLNEVAIYNADTTTMLARASINYDTGVLSWVTDPGSNGFKRVEVYPGGLFKVSLSVWAGITSGNTIRCYFGQYDTVVTAGAYAYFDGLQIERNPFATSHIPSNGAAVTRSADVCSYTWADTAWQAAAYTILGKMVCNMPSRTGAVDGRGPGTLYQTGINIISPFYSPATGIFNVYAGAPDYINVTPGGTVAAFAEIRTAIRMEANNSRAAMNGGAVGTDTSCTIPVHNKLWVGSNNPDIMLNGTIAELKIPKRGFSDAELQAY